MDLFIDDYFSRIKNIFKKPMTSRTKEKLARIDLFRNVEKFLYERFLYLYCILLAFFTVYVYLQALFSGSALGRADLVDLMIIFFFFPLPFVFFLVVFENISRNKFKQYVFDIFVSLSLFINIYWLYISKNTNDQKLFDFINNGVIRAISCIFILAFFLFLLILILNKVNKKYHLYLKLAFIYLSGIPVVIAMNLAENEKISYILFGASIFVLYFNYFFLRIKKYHKVVRD